MDRRTLLTVSTAACLCGMYEAYAMFVGPMLSPQSDLVSKGTTTDRESISSKPAANVRQAEKYLSHLGWDASTAKYQFRSNEGIFYFQEWEPVEETGHVKFQPFAMIWRPKSSKPEDDPYTLSSESAVVAFAEKFDIKNASHLGRVVGGSLKGKVGIRGPNDLAIDGHDFFFAEEATRVWSDQPVNFQQGLHTGRGQGMELDLIPAEGPPNPDKPAVTGVRTVRLLKKVAMELAAKAKSADKPDETVFVDCEGSFEYDVESNVATFHKNVLVNRPTGGGQSDRLKNCELLTLVFERMEKPPAEDADREEKPVPTDDGFGAPGGNLEFRRLRAEGPTLTVISQRSEMEGRMNELTYDAQARVVAMRDAKRVKLVQQNNELFCPEITAVLDESGDVERALCRGAGKLFRYAKPDTGKKSGKKRTVEVAAEWKEQLQKTPDPETGLDLIEFKGRAVINQAGIQSLRGDVVGLWITPQGEKPEEAARQNGDAFAAKDNDRKQPQPKRMLALRDVEFASPKINGRTERLEVWFDEGPLPEPPQAEKPGTASVSGRTKKPAIAKGKPPATQTAGRQPADRDAENPLSLTADVIRVRTLRDSGDVDPQLSEVITEGHVHVTRQNPAGQPPLDLKGDTLHLWQFSEFNQVLDVKGTPGAPAHIQDRGMQIEGPDIHFDRGQNLASVMGSGVLRLPMKKDIQGKLLDTPQMLDVFWREKMEFDGQVAKFFEKVKAQLTDSEIRCEEMQVTFERRISFAEDARASETTEVKHVLCRDNVKLKNYEYKNNQVAEVRMAEAATFAIDRATGRMTSQGPGKLFFWRRGNGKAIGVEPKAKVVQNRGLAAEPSEWEYTQVNFRGKMDGNTNERITTFYDRVSVLYGPVANSTETIDEDHLPKDGGWMRCDRMQLTQHPVTKAQQAYVEMEAAGNTELEGRSFYAMAPYASYDESKGLYILKGHGKQNARIWREAQPGAARSAHEAQRMEFIPSQYKLHIDNSAGGQGAP